MKGVLRILKACGADMRLVLRDPLLAIMPLAPFLASTALRFIFPLVFSLLGRYLGLSGLEVWEPFIRAMLILFPGMFFGMIAGFLILDDRDEGILRYQEATPLGPGGYLASRLGFFSLLAFLAGPFCGIISGFGSFNIFKDIGVSLLGAFQVPFMALFLGAFAANKVEGLSLAKALGLVDLAPLALVAALPLRLVGSPFFQFWATSLLWTPEGGGSGFPWSLPLLLRFFLGICCGLIWIWLLYLNFRKRLE